MSISPPAPWLERSDMTGLRPVGKRPPLPAYIRQTWRRRHFIWADARARALGTQRGTLLGNIWLIVKPMLDALVFFAVFGLLLETNRSIDNFVGYLLVGVTMFPTLQRAITGGGQVMSAGRNLIRSFSFPRVALPISFMIRGALDTLPPLAALLIIVMILPPHAWPSWHWILIVPIFALQNLFALGLALFTSRITAQLPDMRNVWPFVAQFWYFGSGVFFSFDKMMHRPAARFVVDWNPGYKLLTMYRDVILYQRVPPGRDWAVMGLWVLVTVGVGYVFFWAREESYGVER
ncbi:ABC transporter component [Actinomyces sp. Chiba101]|uniref:Teichoic acid transport system permease protein n=1 Tax=Actinomyces denticolens TaxID=52767 RepID=A0ABY1I8A6_9ACTO|nr:MULTISPECIES: ABC transporter permease [Actinomyces]BAW93532.1 ABC transporter component [Actinomyces sp. Chiba101]GAV93621.1 ABC transporter related protein [Actinomyces denticolens]SHI75524.1 teichoic acid transport system permease protein [Actinomyces denticolens]SUU02807.1 ABC-2 type transporter [Actinomyces denticolens]